MKKNILNYVNKLQAYKTAIKNLHWSSKKMSEHKLLDEIADSVADNQDEIAEIAQGIYGKIKKNELKPRRYKITTSLKMLKDLTKDTKDFCDELKGKELTGLRSVVESFISELNKFDYLMDMCIKEDIKRNLKKKLNEKIINKKNISSIVNESCNQILKESEDDDFDDYYEYYDETELMSEDPIDVLSSFEERTTIQLADANAFMIASNFTMYLMEISKHIALEVKRNPEKKDALINGFIEYMNNIIMGAKNNINKVQNL